MFRSSFSWLELSSSSTTFTQTRLPTLFGCTVGRRKRLLTKKTSKEDEILVVGLDSSDSSGSTLTNSAKLLLLCPAAACLLRLLLSDGAQWAKIPKKVQFRSWNFTKFLWNKRINQFHEKFWGIIVLFSIFSSRCGGGAAATGLYFFSHQTKKVGALAEKVEKWTLGCSVLE